MNSCLWSTSKLVQLLKWTCWKHLVENLSSNSSPWLELDSDHTLYLGCKRSTGGLLQPPVGSFSSPRISDEPNTDFFFSFYQQPQTGKTKITEFKLCPIFCDTLTWDLKMQGVEIKPKVGMYWYQRPHFLLVELPFLNVYLWNRVCSEFIVSAVHLLPTDRKKRWSKDQTKITH